MEQKEQYKKITPNQLKKLTVVSGTDLSHFAHQLNISLVQLHKYENGQDLPQRINKRLIIMWNKVKESW